MRKFHILGHNTGGWDYLDRVNSWVIVRLGNSKNKLIILVGYKYAYHKQNEDTLWICFNRVGTHIMG